MGPNLGFAYFKGRRCRRTSEGGMPLPKSGIEDVAPAKSPGGRVDPQTGVDIA